MRRIYKLMLLAVCVVVFLGQGSYVVYANSDDEPTRIRNRYRIIFLTNQQGEISIEVEMFEEERTYQLSLIPHIGVAVSQILNLDNINLRQSLSETLSFTTGWIETDSALSNSIRNTILRNGLGELIDESVATNTDISNQNHARTNRLGIWENWEEYEESSWLERVMPTIIWILSALATMGFFGFLIKQIHKRLRTRKKVVFIGGDKASGKTTLIAALHNPDLSQDELLSTVSSAKVSKQRVVRDDENTKLILDLQLVDYPGDHYHVVLDWFIKNNYRLKEFVAVLVVSPNKSNTNRNYFDSSYIVDQMNTIKKLWVAILNSKAITTPQRLILFVNKSDLFDDTAAFQAEFKNHVNTVRDVCKTRNVTFEVIFGSVVRRNGLQKIVEILKKRR